MIKSGILKHLQTNQIIDDDIINTQQLKSLCCEPAKFHYMFKVEQKLIYEKCSQHCGRFLELVPLPCIDFSKLVGTSKMIKDVINCSRDVIN